MTGEEPLKILTTEKKKLRKSIDLLIPPRGNSTVTVLVKPEIFSAYRGWIMDANIIQFSNFSTLPNHFL